MNLPESNLFLKIIEYFDSNPQGNFANLMSNLDEESSSLIGGLLSSFSLKKENAIEYFKDCIEAIKKDNPKIRIKELKDFLKIRSLTEDEVFELQQHLLTSEDNLDEENINLLRKLSQSSKAP